LGEKIALAGDVFDPLWVFFLGTKSSTERNSVMQNGRVDEIKGLSADFSGLRRNRLGILS